MKPTQQEIQNAKDLLERAGYFVQNLWHIHDVKIHFDCTDEEAMYILEQSLGGEYMNELSYDLIKVIGTENKLKEN
jgi:hypothetical protein